VGLRRTSHSVYDTSYHLVWCPKYRKDIFEGEEVRERAKQMIREICEAYDIEILEMVSMGTKMCTSYGKTKVYHPAHWSPLTLKLPPVLHLLAGDTETCRSRDP
jgi:hypothetical protein